MSTVISTCGTKTVAKAVKNLGWLLRHWSEVAWLGYNYAPDSHDDGELVAKLRDGTVYLTRFASLSVCWKWLDRPSFRGLEFRLVKLARDTDNQRNHVIGSPDWKRIARLPYAEQMAEILDW